jgi:hypothetical protein
MRRLLFVALAAVAALAPLPPSTVERWYSQGVYPRLQQGLTSFSNTLPFSLFDVIWIGGVAVTAAWMYRRARERPTRTAIRRAVVQGVTAASIVYLVFLVT